MFYNFLFSTIFERENYGYCYGNIVVKEYKFGKVRHGFGLINESSKFKLGEDCGKMSRDNTTKCNVMNKNMFLFLQTSEIRNCIQIR